MNRSNMPKQIMTFANGGLASFIPRQTRIMGQPHMLAYINPREEQILQDYRGNAPVLSGPAGVPSYGFWDSVKEFFGGGGNSSSSNNSSSSSSSDNNSSSSAKTNQDRINEIYASSDDPWSEHGAELNNLVADRSGTYSGGGNDNSSSAASNNDDSGGGKYENSRDALETAGYTVSADGNSVYNDSGQVAGPGWSGSSTVTGINNAVNNVGYAGSVSSSNNNTSSNTIFQDLANTFTPFDNQEYVDGVLVDRPSNTLGQTFANIFTPFDNQEYVGGNLVDYDNYGALLPPIPGNDLASSDADGDGIPDYQEFVTLYDAQSTAAANDPTGMSTGTGFIAGSDFSADIDGDGTVENYEEGTQYAVNTDGSVAVAGSAEDLTGGMSQLDSALVNQGLAQDYDGDGVISFDETFGADSTVSSGTGTDTTGGGDGGSDTTDGGDDGSEEGGDDDTSPTAPPSSLNFRFYGGYQPRTRADVLVASPGADQPFVMPDDPRITPIFNPGDNIDEILNPTAIGPTEGYGGQLAADILATDYGPTPFGPIPEATTDVPVFGEEGTIAIPGSEAVVPDFDGTDVIVDPFEIPEFSPLTAQGGISVNEQYMIDNFGYTANPDGTISKISPYNGFETIYDSSQGGFLQGGDAEKTPAEILAYQQRIADQVVANLAEQGIERTQEQIVQQLQANKAKYNTGAPGAPAEAFDFGAPANVGDTYFDPMTNTTYEYTEKPMGNTGQTYQGWDIKSGTGEQFKLFGAQPIDAGMNYGGGALAQAPAEDMVSRQGVASLMAGDPATEAMYQGIMS